MRWHQNVSFQLLEEVRASWYLILILDKNTDATDAAQLLVYILCIDEEHFVEMFWSPAGEYTISLSHTNYFLVNTFLLWQGVLIVIHPCKLLSHTCEINQEDIVHHSAFAAFAVISYDDFWSMIWRRSGLVVLSLIVVVCPFLIIMCFLEQIRADWIQP